MKMYVKPSISVIELQLKENIAAVPTTVYKGSKSVGFTGTAHDDYDLTAKNSGLAKANYDQYGISIL